MKLQKPFTKSEKKLLEGCLGKKRFDEIEQDFKILRLYGGIEAFAIESVLKERLHKLIKAEKVHEKESRLKAFRKKVREYINLAHKKVGHTRI